MSEYARGIRTFPKSQNAPEFVLGNLVINLSEFHDWVEKNPQLLHDYKGTKQVKFQVLKGKNGGINLVVDTYKQKEPEIKNNHDLF